MPMSNNRVALSLFGSAFLLTLALATAHAAKPATPKAQLEKEATHILLGKVQSISFSRNTADQWEITIYIAEIKVDKVEKGSGVNAGDVVQVRYVSNAWRGASPPPEGDSGHRPTPKQDDYVRVYL